MPKVNEDDMNPEEGNIRWEKPEELPEDDQIINPKEFKGRAGGIPLSDEDKAAERIREFEELAAAQPARDVKMPEVNSQEGNTLAAAMAGTEDLTDMQAALRILMPKDYDENSVVIGRIDPGIFLAELHLMSVNEIMMSSYKKPVNVNGIYLKNYVRLSKGLDGMGIVDVLELYGAARDEKRLEGMMSKGAM